MSTSDKFSPLSEPIGEPEPYLEVGHFPAERPAPPRFNLPSQDDGGRFLDLALAIVTLVTSIGLLVLMGLIFVIPYAFHRTGLDQQTLKQFLETDKTAIFLQIASTIPAHLLTLAVVWAVVTRFGKRPFWSTLNWSWGRGFGFWSSSVLAVALLGMGILITKKFGAQETSLDKMIESSMAARYTTAFLATFTAPLVEEMVYRGVLYSALQKIIGTTWAVVGVLLFFTLIHVPQYWPNLAVIAVIGILSFCLTVIRAYTDRLLPCFIIHLIFNGISSVLIVLQPYLESLRSTGEQKASFIMLARSIRLLM